MLHQAAVVHFSFNIELNIKQCVFKFKDANGHVCNWARGAMDNAPDYGSGDSRFESWRARCLLMQESVKFQLSVMN